MVRVTGGSGDGEPGGWDKSQGGCGLISSSVLEAKSSPPKWSKLRVFVFLSALLVVVDRFGGERRMEVGRFDHFPPSSLPLWATIPSAASPAAGRSSALPGSPGPNEVLRVPLGTRPGRNSQLVGAPKCHPLPPPAPEQYDPGPGQ